MKNRMQELAGIGGNVLYSAVILDEESKSKILKEFGDVIPKNWEIVNHHATINLGSLDSQYGYKVGDHVTMNVSKIGISTKAIALEVDIRAKNDIPHITVAINRTEGAKPVDSNYIKEWNAVNSFTVSGVVEEIKK